jgi:hypothetical protein
LRVFFADVRGGLAILLGLAAMVVCARALHISASALWWWPLRDPATDPEGDRK